MKRVTCTEYDKLKLEFLRNHPDYSVTTSPIDQYDTYRKVYSTEKGEFWFEVIGPVYEKATAKVDVKGVEVTLTGDVKLLKTEGWSTDDPNSIVTYEKY